MTWELYSHKTAGAYHYENAFSDDEIKNIIELGENLDFKNGSVENGLINMNMRQNKISWITPNQESEWLFRKLTDYILHANENHFKYDLNSLENLQYTVYNEGDFYSRHMDIQSYGGGKNTRKISFSLQLIDPNEYEGGETVLIHGEDAPISKNKGTITFFPSYTLHEVSQITKGTRKSLVSWVRGPEWK